MRRMNETRYAGVAQLVEQLICNQQVGGSSPSTSSTISASEYGRFPEWPKGADCKSVVNDFGGSNPPPPTKRQSIEGCSVFVLLSKFRIGAMDSKAGSWQHAGCMLQPAWLFRRKANPPPSTKRQSIGRCSVFVLRAEQKSSCQGKFEKPCQLIPALSVAARHLSQRER